MNSSKDDFMSISWGRHFAALCLCVPTFLIGCADEKLPPGQTDTGVAAFCGNGVVEAGEGCDDGNTTDGDGCSANCTLERPA